MVDVSEQEKETVPVSVVALRAESYSASGDNIVVSLRTKYSTAERKYSVPLECFQDLIVDLRRLNTITRNEPGNADSQAERLLRLEAPIAAE
jgi:hypothetical protein